jgi:hypothetical protein
MTNNKQQTAVEWGVEKLASLTFDYMAGFMNKSEYDELSKGIIREAKEMQKEQTIKTSLFWSHSTVKRKDIEDYYNEIYGGGKQ